MVATDESASVIEKPASSAGESRRVGQARSRAERRLSRQRGTLRPLGWAVVVVVAASAIGGHPGPGLHGAALGVTLSLCLFAAALMAAIGNGFAGRKLGSQAAVLSLMGAAGAALAALQPRGATGLAAGAAVWMAVIRLPRAAGLALGAAVIVALDVATALAGSSAAAIFAGTLLCVLLGLIARFLQQARESQERTEVLLAQLEDAREQQLEAAAIAERGRIASELHDVLAHSLSGAAIQLQGARKLAEREQAGPQMLDAIARAGELVRDGLANARRAVGALRGEQLPGVEQLASLVDSFTADTGMDVTLTIAGRARALRPDASLALYRGAQEALTNVARYAPGARTSVVLRFAGDRATLTVDDEVPMEAPADRELSGVGGGRGLAGMRERVERAGGRMDAGPTAAGWRVELDLPA